MDKYNRDGPQGETALWIPVIVGMVAGCLIGELSCLFAAAFLTFIGGYLEVALVLFVTAPLVAMVGGIVGAWLAWKRP